MSAKNTESQQRNRRLKEGPNGNIGSKKYNNQNKKPNVWAQQKNGSDRESLDLKQYNRNYPIWTTDKIDLKKNEQSLKNLWFYNKRPNICAIKVTC